MNQQEKKIDQYLKSVARRLNMPGSVKNRVLSDLHSSILGRMEAGQTVEEILRELGPAKTVAAELNEQMKEYAYIKSPWRWTCLALAVLASGALVLGGVRELLVFLFNGALNQNIGIIGGADGPTAIFIATAGIAWEQLLLMLLLLVMGILGFCKLSRCPRK